MYLIPKELNSKIKVARHINLKEFVLFVVGMGIVFLFASIVAPDATIPYYIFSFLSLAYLLMPAKHNPGKDNYQAIYYMIIRKKNTFHPISRFDIEEVENEIEVPVPKAEESSIEDIKENVIVEKEIIVTEKKAKIVNKKIEDENKNEADIKEDPKESKIILKEGNVVIYNFKGKLFRKNRLFYINSIGKEEFEAYEVFDADDMALLRVNNAINIKKGLRVESVVNLDKKYCLKNDNVLRIKAELDKDTSKRIDDTVTFLKNHGYIAS